MTKEKSSNASVSPSLKENDNILMQYAPIIGGVLLVVLLGVGGYFLYDFYAKKEQEKAATLIYEFKSGPWKKFQDHKLTDEEFLNEWSKLSEKVGKQRPFALLSLEVIRPFVQQKKWDKAIVLLSPQVDQFQNNPYLFYFLGTHLAVIYEDAGDRKKAIALLEDILAKNIKLMDAKIYYDLGRLFQQEGQKDKAVMNFQYVVDNFPDDKLAQLARIHLKQLQ